MIEELTSLYEIKTYAKKNHKTRNKIIQELQYLNYNLKYNGTRYLAETILELHNKKEFFYDNLSRNIYPVIAKKYQKTVNNIKCNITQATKIMYYDCNQDILDNYFGINYNSQPKVKEVIFQVLNKI